MLAAGTVIVTIPADTPVASPDVSYNEMVEYYTSMTMNDFEDYIRSAYENEIQYDSLTGDTFVETGDGA